MFQVMAEGRGTLQGSFAVLHSSPCRFGDLVFLGPLMEVMDDRTSLPKGQLCIPFQRADLLCGSEKFD